MGKTHCLMAYFLVSFFFGLVSLSCSKGDGPEGELPLVFESLTTERDTIAAGDVTKITARATGSRLTYHWSVSIGIILGSGEQVVYTTDPCQAGESAITCIVKDAHGASEEKSVKVFVTAL